MFGSSSEPVTKTPTTSTSATAALQDRIAAAESRLTAVENNQGQETDVSVEIDAINAKISSLEGQVSSSSNQADIDNLQGQIDALVDELDSITDPDNPSSPLITNEAIRWRFDNPVIYDYATDAIISNANLVTDVRPDVNRVDEEGIYYLDLTITNTSNPIVPGGIDLDTCYIKFTMRPYSSSDYTLLDEDSVYLDTDEPPYISWVATPFAEPGWSTSYDTRTREGQEVTKKVIFESDRCAMGDLKGTIKLTLFLELYYAD